MLLVLNDILNFLRHFRQNVLYSEDVNKNPASFICSVLFKCVSHILISLHVRGKIYTAKETNIKVVG